jgi:hypothetical protein
MPFKRTSDKPLYLALTKAEITDLRKGFGLRSAAAKVDSYAGRAHVLRGYYSAAAAAAAHAAPAEAVFHVRVRPQAVENLDHVAIDEAGQLLLVASEPFALNLYEFEVHVPNVLTNAWEWLAVRYYGLAAADFNDLVITRAGARGNSTAKAVSLSRAQWFAMMRRTGQLRATARAA